MNQIASGLGALADTTVVKTAERNIRVFPGNAPSPAGIAPTVLYEQPGLVAWVGKRHSSGALVDVVPVFIARENNRSLSATTAGIVLLVDFLRDTTPENRAHSTNFTLPTFDDIEKHIELTWGSVTLDYARHRLIGHRLGTELSHFLAKRIGRVLRVNYLAGSRLVGVDGARIVLTTPHTLLTKFDSNSKFATFRELATYLGTRWLEADARFLAKHPELEDRSRFFGVAGALPEDENGVIQLEGVSGASAAAS